MARAINQFPARKLLGKRSIIILILMVLVIGGWMLFGGSHEEAGGKGGKAAGGKGGKQQTPIVTVVPTAHKDVPVFLDGLGTVQAYNTVTVHSQVDGQLVAVLFKEGQEVKAGDVLAKIDPRIYQAAYDQAVANKGKNEALLENAKRDFERYTNLGNTISGQVLDTQKASVRQLEASVKSDQAAIDTAKTQLNYATITSPINGRTGLRQVDVGNIVRTGDANGLVVITQVQPISVIFSLPQQNLQAINQQMQLQGVLKVEAVDASGNTVLDTGVLELIDNQIDQNTGTIKLKATFPNDTRALWPGGFSNIRLLLNTRENALVIPANAVQRGPQTTYVFVYKPEDSTVEMRMIKLGMTEGADAVIDDGLKDGEQVVTDNAGKLQDGSKVALPSVAEAPAVDGVKPTDAAVPGEKKKHQERDKKE